MAQYSFVPVQTCELKLCVKRFFFFYLTQLNYIIDVLKQF